MFDISNTLLLYRELNNKRNIYVSKRADRKYAPAAHGIDLMMVLYVLCVCVWCAETQILSESDNSAVDAHEK